VEVRRKTIIIMKNHFKELKEKYPNGFVYGIIAGHGGVKDGVYQILKPGTKQVTFPDGLKIFEGQENRHIKDTLMAISGWEPGIEVVDVVPEQEDIPLNTRVQRVKSLHRKYEQQGKKLLIFELHLNAFRLNQAQGREVFTTRGEDFSDVMAEIWWDKANKVVPDQVKRPGNDNPGPDKEADFFVIKNMDTYGILIEFFFFDNRKEVDLYCNPKGYANWAETVLRTMMELNRRFKEA
jgi:N-acetylmuramoyl-L-alanine amidase